MANHIRQQVRDAIVAAVTNLTTTGTRVHGARVHPLQVSQLPALSVYIVAEDAETLGISSPAQIERVLEVRVLGMAGESGVPDDTLDLIAKEVEVALSGGVTISTRNIPLSYRGASIQFEGGERSIGTIELQYQARIFNASNAPDVFI